MVHPDVKNWIRFAKFEEGHGFIKSARSIFERAVEFFGDEYMEERLFIAFAKFEENQKEHDRARVIYKYALDRMPKEKCQDLYKAYTIHEKKFGERAGIETVILHKRRLQYESEVTENPNNYDAWFDLIRLVESEGDRDTIREMYERAISNIPPVRDKKEFWRRYIYLWIYYAVYEELEAQDVGRARQVYKTCLDHIPHKRFTFAKVWLLYAHFEVRQRDLTAARRALGCALGKCPKAKLFRGYIDLEIQLREFSRCRTLYEKFLLFDPENCSAWMKFAELETLLGETDRARAIYELAVNQPRLDMPEILWKAYIDFEIEQDEPDRARDLYRALLTKTQHVKVWMSFAQFELSVESHDERVAQARHVYDEGNQSLRSEGGDNKEHRLMLLEAWREFEREHGDEKSQQQVQDMMPKRVKKRRKIDENDESQGWEEYFDYIFPQDENARPNLKLLAMAKMWKKQKEQQQQEELQEQVEKSETDPPKSDAVQMDAENPDADDEDIRNESDSSDENEES